VRFKAAEDVEMPEPVIKESLPKKPLPKDAPFLNDVTKELDDLGPSKTTGRKSRLSETVDTKNVMDWILDTTVVLSLREIMVTSKDLRTEFQELIKVRNVRAVLLGNSADHPLIANTGWPRTEGILIKIDMKTGGNKVCAIIDTGSQLDVV
jgi:hypothetical protein